MDSVIQYANRVLQTRNIRMALATLRALQNIIKGHAASDPQYYTELNNLSFRIKMLLEPLNQQAERNPFMEKYEKVNPRK